MTQMTEQDLNDLRLPELRERFQQVTGETTRCPNKQWLIRRILEAAQGRAAHPSSMADGENGSRDVDAVTAARPIAALAEAGAAEPVNADAVATTPAQADTTPPDDVTESLDGSQDDRPLDRDELGE